MLKAKRNKYGAKKTVIDGITFDSKAEAKRYGELRLLQRAELIEDLEVHPQFPLVIAGTKVGNYFADFKYQRDGRTVIEDVKGVRTAVYKLKKNIVEALYGITIEEKAA